MVIWLNDNNAQPSALFRTFQQRIYKKRGNKYVNTNAIRATPFNLLHSYFDSMEFEFLYNIYIEILREVVRAVYKYCIVHKGELLSNQSKVLVSVDFDIDYRNVWVARERVKERHIKKYTGQPRQWMLYMRRMCAHEHCLSIKSTDS